MPVGGGQRGWGRGWMVALLLAACAGCTRPPAASLRPAPDDLIAQRLPRVAYRGGPFVRQPRVVTITFAGDDPELVGRLEQFGAVVTRSSWWRQVMEGYCSPAGQCVGEGRPGASVRLVDHLPGQVHELEVGALLAREAEAGRFGPVDPETLLLAYLPAAVSLSDAFVPRHCAGGARALHRALQVGQLRIPFLVIPRCGEEPALTATASHEIAEAVTNPDPARRGFAFERRSENLSFTFAGVEPVDPCGVLGLLDPDGNRVREGGFVFQRVWSNRAAAAGREPCVPADEGAPFLALIPSVPVLRLEEVGQGATVLLQARADRPAPSWNITAVDLSSVRGGPACADLSLDRRTISAGEVAQLAVRLRRSPSEGECVIGLLSSGGARSFLWPLAVVGG